MNVLQKIGNGILWMLALMGLVSGGLALASQIGWVQPVVVVSGSMNPTIESGDLLIATATRIEDLQVGSVATLMSAHTERFVTHRVVAVEADGDQFAVSMKGDANGVVDDEIYLVPAGARVWQPAIVLPGIGAYAAAVSRPAVALPGLIAIAALIATGFIPPARTTAEDLAT